MEILEGSTPFGSLPLRKCSIGTCWMKNIILLLNEVIDWPPTVTLFLNIWPDVTQMIVPLNNFCGFEKKGKRNIYKWFRYNIFIWLFLATESFLSSHKTETVKRTTQGCRLPVMKKKKKYSYFNWRYTSVSPTH